MAESFNHFPKISEALHTALSQVVRKTAFDIQAKAASNAPVDTGFLKNSIYTVTSEGSTYGQGGSSTHKGSYLLPEVEKPEDDLTAYIGVGANYGIYLEYGTRYMAPRPYFLPAVEATRGPFEEALSRIEEKLKEVAR